MKYILVCTILGLAGFGAAQQTKTGEGDALSIQQAMVVTAQFTPESAKESIYQVKVIDKAEIQARAASNLRDLLRLELNMDLTQHSVFGSGAAISGLSQENVKILRDGIPIVGRLNGVIDLEQIHLEGVQQVEIIEGPVSVYHGTDALAGVINLISEAPTAKGSVVSLDGIYRDTNDLLHNIGASHAVGRHGFKIQLSGRDFDGYTVQDDSRRQDWSEREQEHGEFGYRLQLGGFSINYGAHYSDEALIDRGEPQDGIALDTHYATKRYDHQVSMRGYAAERIYLDFTLSYAAYERNQTRDIYNTITQDISPDNTPSAFDRTTFNQWLARGLMSAPLAAESLQLQIGYELSLEEGEGGRITEGGQEMKDYAAFAGLRWQPAPGLVIQPALRYIDHSIYDAPLTPALNIKYDTEGPFSFRGGYSRGYRGASLKELFLDFTMAAGPFIYHIVGNQDLKAERGHNYTLGANSNFGLANGDALQLDAALFYNDIDNLIALSAAEPAPNAPRTFQRQYINIDRHKTRGGQINLAWQSDIWHLGVGLANTGLYNSLSQAWGTPAFNHHTDANLQFALRPASGWTNYNVHYKFSGRRTAWYLDQDRQSGATTARETVVDDFHQLDLSTSTHFFDNSLNLQLGVKNLFDVENKDSLDVLSGAAHATQTLDWGRTWYIRMGYNWRQ